MKDPLKKIRPEILKISAYLLKPHPYSIKLNQNENPFDAPDFIKEQLAMKVLQRPWGRYPDFYATGLCQKLATHTGWVPEGITVGNGSNELLQLALHLVLERGKKLLLVTPTFALYRIIGLSNAASILEVSFENFHEFPGRRLLETIERESPEALVFCSPNNPTGTSMDEGMLRQILELTDGLVVLDQAYHEFSEYHGIEAMKIHAHLVITRTFSKAMAAAGLRVGYLMAHPEVIRQVNKVKLPYNVNFVTLAAAEAMLDNFSSFVRPIQELVKERRRLYREMSEIDGIEVFPSQANFLLFRVRDAARVFGALQQKGILIRDVSSTPGLENCLRVTVGLSHENEQFLSVLKESVP
ncbi:MAG: histidinol-phosphate transaminase [Acidobacteria bacterium]|nr:histidinol-phosphate transaminase [Acidobacteriota bacterium]